MKSKKCWRRVDEFRSVTNAFLAFKEAFPLWGETIETDLKGRLARNAEEGQLGGNPARPRARVLRDGYCADGGVIECAVEYVLSDTRVLMLTFSYELKDVPSRAIFDSATSRP